MSSILNNPEKLAIYASFLGLIATFLGFIASLEIYKRGNSNEEIVFF